MALTTTHTHCGIAHPFCAQCEHGWDHPAVATHRDGCPCATRITPTQDEAMARLREKFDAVRPEIEAEVGRFIAERSRDYERGRLVVRTACAAYAVTADGQHADSRLSMTPIYDPDPGACELCGEQFREGQDRGEFVEPSGDHVVAHAQGGRPAAGREPDGTDKRQGRIRMATTKKKQQDTETTARPGARKYDRETLGPKVTALRDEEGLSWAKIADRVGVTSPHAVRRIYRDATGTHWSASVIATHGGRLPTTEEALAAKLDVDPSLERVEFSDDTVTEEDVQALAGATVVVQGDRDYVVREGNSLGKRKDGSRTFNFKDRNGDTHSVFARDIVAVRRKDEEEASD